MGIRPPLMPKQLRTSAHQTKTATIRTLINACGSQVDAAEEYHITAVPRRALHRHGDDDPPNLKRVCSPRGGTTRPTRVADPREMQQTCSSVSNAVSPRGDHHGSSARREMLESESGYRAGIHGEREKIFDTCVQSPPAISRFRSGPGRRSPRFRTRERRDSVESVVGEARRPLSLPRAPRWSLPISAIQGRRRGTLHDPILPLGDGRL